MKARRRRPRPPMICNRATSRPEDPALVAFALRQSGEPVACFRKAQLRTEGSHAAAQQIVAACRCVADAPNRARGSVDLVGHPGDADRTESRTYHSAARVCAGRLLGRRRLSQPDQSRLHRHLWTWRQRLALREPAQPDGRSEESPRDHNDVCSISCTEHQRLKHDFSNVHCECG
jgi:hypothetical protein